MEEGQELPENKPAESPDEKGRKESLYDKIPLTKRQLDVIIAILIAAIIIFLTLGALIGNNA